MKVVANVRVRNRQALKKDDWNGALKKTYGMYPFFLGTAHLAGF